MWKSEDVLKYLQDIGNRIIKFEFEDHNKNIPPTLSSEF